MELLIDDYLRSTSTLAKKIAQDLDTAREAYQDIWVTLNEKEQKQVLDEAIIDPAAVLKYSNIKNIEPDDCYKYRSGSQFSWFTRSQLNLFSDISLEEPKTTVKKAEALITDNINKVPEGAGLVIENKNKENNLFNKIKNKVIQLKVPSSVEEKQSLMESKTNTPVVLKSVLSKPKTPPPPPPTKQVMSEKKALLSVDIDSDPDDIPKTGFDFLDNW